MELGLGGFAASQADAAEARLKGVRAMLVRLRADQPTTEKDVELAQEAADAALESLQRVRQSAAEVRVAATAVSRAAVAQAAGTNRPATRPGARGRPDRAGRPRVPRPPLPLVQLLAPGTARPVEVHRLGPTLNADTPARTRAYVRSRCGSLPAEVTEVAVLLTSELVNNAIWHAAGDACLDIALGRGALTVAVTDEGGGDVRLADWSRWPESGHGLRLVEALSDRWGVDPVEGPGKRVWFELTV